MIFCKLFYKWVNRWEKFKDEKKKKEWTEHYQQQQLILSKKMKNKEVGGSGFSFKGEVGILNGWVFIKWVGIF